MSAESQNENAGRLADKFRMHPIFCGRFSEPTLNNAIHFGILVENIWELIIVCVATIKFGSPRWSTNLCTVASHYLVDPTRSFHSILLAKSYWLEFSSLHLSPYVCLSFLPWHEIVIFVSSNRLLSGKQHACWYAKPVQTKRINESIGKWCERLRRK